MNMCIWESNVLHLVGLVFSDFLAPTQGFTQQVTDHTQMKLTEQLTPFLK